MKAWTTWFEELGSTVKDPGNPFTPMAKGCPVLQGGAQISVYETFQVM